MVMTDNGLFRYYANNFGFFRAPFPPPRVSIVIVWRVPLSKNFNTAIILWDANPIFTFYQYCYASYSKSGFCKAK